jgi:hypothetical protein
MKHGFWKRPKRMRRKAVKKVDFTSIPLAKRPEAKVWEVLTSQATQGQAILLQDGEAYFVQFPDELEPLPFEQLAYNSELGLYDKRRFPNR